MHYSCSFAVITFYRLTELEVCMLVNYISYSLVDADNVTIRCLYDILIFASLIV